MESTKSPRQDFKTHGHYDKVKSSSQNDVVHLQPIANIPTKYQLSTPFQNIAQTRFYRSRSLQRGQRSNQGHMTLHTYDPHQSTSCTLHFIEKNTLIISLLDEDEVSISMSSQVPVSQKNRSLEDKLDRFFSEFAVLSQRIQNLEQKDSETAGSHVSSSRDSVQVACGEI